MTDAAVRTYKGEGSWHCDAHADSPAALAGRVRPASAAEPPPAPATPAAPTPSEHRARRSDRAPPAYAKSSSPGLALHRAHPDGTGCSRGGGSPRCHETLEPVVVPASPQQRRLALHAPDDEHPDDPQHPRPAL